MHLSSVCCLNSYMHFRTITQHCCLTSKQSLLKLMLNLWEFSSHCVFISETSCEVFKFMSTWSECYIQFIYFVKSFISILCNDDELNQSFSFKSCVINELEEHCIQMCFIIILRLSFTSKWIHSYNASLTLQDMYLTEAWENWLSLLSEFLNKVFLVHWLLNQRNDIVSFHLTVYLSAYWWR